MSDIWEIFQVLIHSGTKTSKAGRSSQVNRSVVNNLTYMMSVKNQKDWSKRKSNVTVKYLSCTDTLFPVVQGNLYHRTLVQSMVIGGVPLCVNISLRKRWWADYQKRIWAKFREQSSREGNLLMSFGKVERVQNDKCFLRKKGENSGRNWVATLTS